MTPAARMARENAITDALRAADIAIGKEVPTDQALRIIAAIKRLRAGEPACVTSLDRIDYLERVQAAARAAWIERHGVSALKAGIEHDAVAGIDTPIGRLKAVVWKRAWAGVRGMRIVWASEYYLDDQPITVAEVKAAGLAQRPTTRNRKRVK